MAWGLEESEGGHSKKLKPTRGVTQKVERKKWPLIFYMKCTQACIEVIPCQIAQNALFWPLDFKNFQQREGDTRTLPRLDRFALKVEMPSTF